MKFLDWVYTHPSAYLAAAWLFSVAVGTMPALSPNAPWIVRWGHDFLQAAAANLNRKTSSETTIRKPDVVETHTQISGPAETVPPSPKQE